MKRTIPSISLPTERAFVVQITAEAKPEEGDISGRVEHVVSMKAIHFHSFEELMSFIARMLAAGEADDDSKDSE